MITLLLSSCQDKVVSDFTFIGYSPIYQSYDDMRGGIKSDDVQELKNPGKIYFYQNYLLVNEKMKGIHFFDNSNPAAPVQVAYINIPGNLDMVVKGNTLYADSYVDLVSIDISDLTSVRLLERTKDVFSYKVPYPGTEYDIGEVDPSKGVVVGFEVKEVSKREVQESNSTRWFFTSAEADVQFSGPSSPSSAQASSGIGGSTASLTMVGDYLYSVDHEMIKVFSLDGIQEVYDEETDYVLETIFPVDDKLFIGTTTGMLIYNLNDPESPNFVSVFVHAVSCDPVVVEGDYAYVTLRTGTRCGGWLNQLDILDISNLEEPTLLKTQSMTNPHGLGIDDTTLFICDGTAGLKIYDVDHGQNSETTLIYEYPDIVATDVIPLKQQELLILVSEEGIFQYDYSDLNNISLLSSIE